MHLYLRSSTRAIVIVSISTAYAAVFSFPFLSIPTAPEGGFHCKTARRQNLPAVLTFLIACLGASSEVKVQIA